jgi:pyruvate ferredoxin oxidoreductase gamma subunit
VNSTHSAAEFRASLPGYRIVPVDGLAISRQHGLGRIVNSALLGALARAVGDPPLAVLQYLLQTESPKLRDENVAACTAGYRAVEAQLSEAA